MCGGRRTIRSRSHAGVSPVRTAVRMPGAGMPRSKASLLELGERGLQVAPDVVAEGLERRHVDDLDPIVEPPREARRHQPVEADEEGSEGLPGAGGGRHQHIAAGPDGRPRLELRRRRGGEPPPEPLRGEGMEVLHGGAGGLVRGTRFHAAGSHLSDSRREPGKLARGRARRRSSGGAPGGIGSAGRGPLDVNPGADVARRHGTRHPRRDPAAARLRRRRRGRGRGSA